MNSEEQFNWWLTCIPDNINDLEKELPSEIASKLDGSFGSLDILENYLFENYTAEQMTAPSMYDFLQKLASYVGDLAEKNMNGSFWAINLDDKKDVDFGFPTLKFRDSRPSFNPFTYITTALDRKKGNLISTAIKRRQN